MFLAIEFTKTKRYYRSVPLTYNRKMQMSTNKMELKSCSNTKFKKKVTFFLVGLIVVLVIAIVVFSLLLHRPAYYDPPDFVYSKEVSPYLTHELLPQLYNGVQRQEPFDLYVSQEGINDVIARSKWPRKSDGIRFSAPEVLFVPDRIVLIGTVAAADVEFVVTVVAEPAFDQEGLLNVRLAKVKIGAMNITPLARIVARRMYQRRLAAKDIDTKDLRAQIAASFLNNEPFAPVFEIEDKKVQVQKVTISDGELIFHLTAADK